MIDFHTHILARVDDGAKDSAESLLLLSMLKEQGVDTVFATPHFDAKNDTPARFLSRRDRARDLLLAAAGDADLPALRMGAEVAFYAGISASASLRELALEGTDILLLEMPIGPWSAHTVSELTELAYLPDLTVLLAHVERYLPFVGRRTIERLHAHGILMQINASSLVAPLRAWGMRRLIREGIADIIASDCHGAKYRPPMLGEAYEAVETKLGAATRARLCAFARSLLERNYINTQAENPPKGVNL